MGHVGSIFRSTWRFHDWLPVRSPLEEMGAVSVGSRPGRQRSGWRTTAISAQPCLGGTPLSQAFSARLKA